MGLLPCRRLTLCVFLRRESRWQSEGQDWMDGYCTAACLRVRVCQSEGTFLPLVSGDQHANHRFNAARSSVFCPPACLQREGETCSASAASGDDNSIFSARPTGLTEISSQISPSWVNIWHSAERAGRRKRRCYVREVKF